MNLSETNTVALIAAPVIVAVVTWWLTLKSKGFENRGQAEATLIGIGPVIIQAQNLRIGELETRLNSMWAELAEARAAERNCLQRLVILEDKLGIQK